MEDKKIKCGTKEYMPLHNGMSIREKGTISYQEYKKVLKRIRLFHNTSGHEQTVHAVKANKLASKLGIALPFEIKQAD